MTHLGVIVQLVRTMLQQALGIADVHLFPLSRHVPIREGCQVGAGMYGVRIFRHLNEEGQLGRMQTPGIVEMIEILAKEAWHYMPLRASQRSHEH